MSVTEMPLILTYHTISPGRSPLRIPPEVFAGQMEWLKSHASVVGLRQLVEALREPRPLLPRSVVLTFDDGCASFYTHAAPILGRLSLPAIVFLPTQFVGRTNAWPGQPAWVEEQALLNWQQVRELAGQGYEFGSHSASHPALTEVSAAELERELSESKQQIERETHRPVDFFCYPYGRWNPEVQAAVRKRYDAACSTVASTVGPGADLFALPRIDAHYVRNPAWFRSLFTRRFGIYIAARRAIRGLRGQPEGG